ncbi:hypothetical protein BDR07DRAFT_694147 [Suillus spraguei]|nr:hypothetical protein BDR07DRAFT_694147 [Suillus spraguei]
MRSGAYVTSAFILLFDFTRTPGLIVLATLFYCIDFQGADRSTADVASLRLQELVIVNTLCSSSTRLIAVFQIYGGARPKRHARARDFDLLPF